MLTQAQFDAAWTLLVLLALAYSLRRLNVAYTRLKEKAKTDKDTSEGAAGLAAFLCVVNFCALVGYFLFNAKALVAFIFLE